MQNEHLAQTPDTLDLVTRARYAINAITRSTNPEAEYAVYFTGVLHRNPPTLLREIPLYGKIHGRASVNAHHDKRQIRHAPIYSTSGC